MKMNLGSGRDPRPDYLNVDVNPYWKPDVVLDIGKIDFANPPTFSTRFGDVTFAENTFDEIIAIQVLEHIPDLVSVMSSCVKLLKLGGVMKASVPYDLSYGAWQDPTHVRAFNENSWIYYTEWAWYLGWTEYKFQMKSLWYVYSRLGQQMSAEGKTVDEITRSPRAVTDVNVEMIKVKVE